MQDEFGPAPAPSFSMWVLSALGFKYAIILAMSASLVFVLTLLVVARGKGPMAGVALLFIVPIPLLIGAYAAIEGGIQASFQIAVVSQSSGPRQDHVAAAISYSLVRLMVGMLLMAPSYLLAALGSLFRAFPAEPESLKARGEKSP